MFRNRALTVSVTKKPGDSTHECNHLDPEQISKIAKDVMVHAAAVVVAVKLFDTVSKIAVIAAKAKIR
jgi:hypothetical protein